MTAAASLQRVRATRLMGFTDVIGRQLYTTEQRGELERCAASFTYFLRYWCFNNRETGKIQAFDTLWPGQAAFAALMETEPWIFALKAGKLGFTELECAYDAWVLRFRQPNARVHLFSMDARAAQSLLGYIRFGLTHLPTWMQLPFATETAGADTATTLRLRAGTDDTRTVVSYAASAHAAIDQSALHCHVDELAHMAFAEKTWNSVETTVAPDGTCHIVTRGAGDANYAAELWNQAQSPVSRLYPFFQPWTARPDREGNWREEHETSLTLQGVLHFAPESPEDALAGDETAMYIPPAVWERCYDPDLPPFLPGDGMPTILGVDGAVTGDMFAVVAVTRHPKNNDNPAIRAAKVWDPRKERGGMVPFDEIERFLAMLCKGGCRDGHPKPMPDPLCPLCRAGQFDIPPYNITCIVYDPHQVQDMMQRFRRRGVVWCEEFEQGERRLVADAMLYKFALSFRLSHFGDPMMAEHVNNARAKLSPDEDSKMRIVTKAPARKVDLVVASSMAVSKSMELLI